MVQKLISYEEALDYLYAHLPMFHRQGASAYKKDLHNILALTKAIGDPHKHLKYIHIAGTNGKGSVSHILAAVLQAQGYKTGLYISPHYKDFRERIRINGQNISEEKVIQFINDHASLFEEIKPSFFEMTLALAFTFFQQENVDYVILETGLGGRLDSTNIVHPLMSIITNISYDHTDLLGDTLEKIAFEKAGIIKAETPVIIGRKQVETKPIFIHKAEMMHSKLYFAEDEINIEAKYDEFGIKEIELGYEGTNHNLLPKIKANYQIENIRTAIAACKILAEHQLIPITFEAIKEALEHTISQIGFMGRWQWLKTNGPFIVADSAHNEDGLSLLFEQIHKFPYHRLHIVCGFVGDKPLDKVLHKFPMEADYYFCKAAIPRGLDALILKNKANTFSLFGEAYNSVKEAFEAAQKNANTSDLILVTGSIFVIAEIV